MWRGEILVLALASLVTAAVESIFHLSIYYMQLPSWSLFYHLSLLFFLPFYFFSTLMKAAELEIYSILYVHVGGGV